MQVLRTAGLLLFCGVGIVFFAASGLGRLGHSDTDSITAADQPGKFKGQCADREDNDGDGLTDKQDPDCYGSADPSEESCSDGSAFCDSWCAAEGSNAVKCIGFDDPNWLAEMGYAWQPKHGRCRGNRNDPNQCMTVDARETSSMDSAGALRLENPLDVRGELPRSGSLPIQFNDDGVSDQFGAGTDFWVQYDMRVDQQWIDHLSPKQIFINEGDQGNWRQCVKSWSNKICAASCTDMEIVAQEAWNVDYYGIYHGCPGPQGNKVFEYIDNTRKDGNPACGRGGYEFRRQLVDGMCCSNDSSDCVFFRANEWFRYWVHVTIGPDWDAADDRVEVYIRRPGDDARILVVDSDVSALHGDSFQSRLRNCGYCSGDASKTCWTSTDCGGSGECGDRHLCGGGSGTGSGKYGKLWIDNRSALHGKPQPGAIAYAWYDNLIIGRSDPGDAPMTVSALPE